MPIPIVDCHSHVFKAEDSTAHASWPGTATNHDRTGCAEAQPPTGLTSSATSVAGSGTSTVRRSCRPSG